MRLRPPGQRRSRPAPDAVPPPAVARPQGEPRLAPSLALRSSCGFADARAYLRSQDLAGAIAVAESVARGAPRDGHLGSGPSPGLEHAARAGLDLMAVSVDDERPPPAAGDLGGPSGQARVGVR